MDFHHLVNDLLQHLLNKSLEAQITKLFIPLCLIHILRGTAGSGFVFNFVSLFNRIELLYDRIAAHDNLQRVSILFTSCNS